MVSNIEAVCFLTIPHSYKSSHKFLEISHHHGVRQAGNEGKSEKAFLKHQGYNSWENEQIITVATVIW